MKKNCQRICLIFSAAAVMLICGSCTPNKITVKAEAVGKKVSIDKEKAVEETDETKDADVSSVLSVISEPEGRDFLLYHEVSLTDIYPEDFAIGPLQQTVNMDDTESAIYLLANNFSESIFNDDLNADLLYSKRKSFVLRNLSDFFEKNKMSEYRLGLINLDSDPARADIRFLGNNEYIDGTMYFIREGNWKIFDLQFRNLNSGSNEKMSNEKWFPIYNKVQ